VVGVGARAALLDAPRRRHAAGAGGAGLGMEAGGALAAALRGRDAAAGTGVGVRNGVEVVAGGDFAVPAPR
jgi:hypothetical protein